MNLTIAAVMTYKRMLDSYKKETLIDLFINFVSSLISRTEVMVEFWSIRICNGKVTVKSVAIPNIVMAWYFLVEYEIYIYFISIKLLIDTFNCTESH